MANKKFLADREKALEDLFFEKANRELVERLKQERERADAKVGLSNLTGIQDETILQKLVDLDIDPGTWAALALIPLLEVAWADEDLDEKERRAILSAAEANGIVRTSPGFDFLEAWLNEKPDPRFLEVWGEYIVDLCSRLSSAEREALEREIMGRARSVAEAAGGILGFGSKISAPERTALEKLEKAFRR